VGGGGYNTSSGNYNTVSGGNSNTSSGDGSTVGGGNYVGGGNNNTSSGSNSTVGGGGGNLAFSPGSFIGAGQNNVAAQKVRRANPINSSTTTITVLGAVAADFDNTTANALQIRYKIGTAATAAFASTTRTVSTATQSGPNVALVVTDNVGAVSPNQWTNVTVVNTAETDTSAGQVVGGGINNISTNTNSTVGGGTNNTSSGLFSTVGGGASNNASGYGSTVGGGYSYRQGNTASGKYSTIGGGGGGYYYAFRAAAYNYPQNIASGYLSTIAGGSSNNAIGYFSSIPGGFGAKTSIPGELAHSAGIFSQIGDAQHSIFILKGTTTNATPLNLLAGTSAVVTNFQQEIIIPSETIFSGTINIIGTRNTGANVARYLRQFTIKNVGGTPSLVGSIITLGRNVADGTSISITAVNSTPAVLRIAVTGKASENWRWVAVVDCVSVQFEPV